MIRQVEDKDFNQIEVIASSLNLNSKKIHQAGYRLQVQKEGFLVGEYTGDDFNKDLNKIFLIYEDLGRILGYIRIDDKPEFKKTKIRFGSIKN